MKILSTFFALFVLTVSCDTPSGISSRPDPTTNTSGSTGSGTMTNTNNTPADVRNPAGTPVDTALAKVDSLPKDSLPKF